MKTGFLISTFVANGVELLDALASSSASYKKKRTTKKPSSLINLGLVHILVSSAMAPYLYISLQSIQRNASLFH